MEITITNQQDARPFNEDALLAAARAVLADSRFSGGRVNVAVVDDATIHDLNRRHLDHDWPTDVLSYALAETDDTLEGEIVVSAETAASQAAQYGWTPAEELLLYVVHGALHLAGYCDKTPAEADAMRAAEARFLERLGVSPPPREELSSAEQQAALALQESGGKRAS